MGGDFKIRFANAVALTTAATWLLCSLFVWLFPRFSFKVFKWWLHEMAIEKIGGFKFTFEGVVLGGITMVVSFWVVGYVLAWSFERFKVFSK